eukprot:8823886-Pyramimonas_sp.AAC.1
MEDGSSSKNGCRLSAAHIRLKVGNIFTDGRRIVFQNVALALSPRTLILNSSQQLQGWRTGRVENIALALAPRIFVQSKL